MEEIKKEEAPVEIPKEETKPQETSIETSAETPKEIPKEEAPKETPIEVSKEAQKEEIKEEIDPKDKYSLETGRYKMYSPENGDIYIDTIELKSITGAHRIWKVRSLSQKQIILDVIKFG